MTLQSGYVKKWGDPKDDLTDIFRYFMIKNHPLEIKKKKLELERLLSVSNRDSYLSNELNN